jgi:hypothetical protein
MLIDTPSLSMLKTTAIAILGRSIANATMDAAGSWSARDRYLR